MNLMEQIGRGYPSTVLLEGLVNIEQEKSW